MGEAKQEKTKAEANPEENEEEKEEKAEVKQEDKPEEEKEEKKEEEDEAKPFLPPPIVLYVDLHCVGCARKIERAILKCKGVESVVLDMVQNNVTVTGLVDPEALCSRIQKKTLRRAKILSPLPPAEGDSKPAEVIPAQVSGINLIELLANMHCEACAQQLRRKILKMRGVQTAETNFTAGKVIVTGTMNGEKLVEYIHRRTGKLATIVPPPPPPPSQEEEKKNQEQEQKPAEENKDDQEKKEDSAEKKGEEKKAEEKEEGNNKEEKGSGGEEGPIKNEIADGTAVNYNPSYYNPSDVEMMKRMIYWNGGFNMNEDDMARRMPPWMAPVYVVQPPPPPPPLPPHLLYRTPPPQIFSDENPNACCIS